MLISNINSVLVCLEVEITGEVHFTHPLDRKIDGIAIHIHAHHTPHTHCVPILHQMKVFLY